MIPAEYSTVEFETRMASYSDDENPRDEPEHIKQKRRETSTDAWVDIVVPSQNNKAGGQDAEIGVSPERRRLPFIKQSDPNIVGLEVAEVLASVPNRSPSPPSMLERVDQSYGYDMDQHVKDLHIDEVETVPRTSEASAETDESDASAGLAYDASSQGHGDVPTGTMNARQMARHQRRLGYFDLHPERRQAAAQSMVDEEDPRAKLARDDSEDEEDDDRLYGPPEGVRPLPVPPVVIAPIPQPTLFEPTPLVPKKSTVQSTVPTLNQTPVVRQVNTTLTTPAAPANGHGVPPVTPSKTAALIEMYRERERGSTTPVASATTPIVIAPLSPSRLPVRSTSLGKDTTTLPLPQIPQIPLLTVPTPTPKVSPKPSPLEPELTDLARLPLEDTGRNSPARYIHGAPLHNVIEEEEE